MAKISALPAADPLTGDETVPLVQDGETRSINPADHLAYIAQGAELARDQAADLVQPQNIFVDVALAVAEAAVAENVFFKLVSSATGMADVRRRDAEGSTLLYQEATVAALDAPGGAAIVRTQSGENLQQFVDKMPRPVTAAPAFQTVNIKAEEYIDVGCVIGAREEIGEWAIFDDANHASVGYNAIDVNVTAPQTITLHHDSPRGKNVSAFALPDETFSQMGVTPGVSSNLNDTRITLTGEFNLVFSALAAPAITGGNSYLTPDCAVTWDAVNLEWEVTHNTLLANNLPIAQFNYQAGVATRYRTPVSLAVRRVNANTTRISAIAKCDAHFTYDGANWNIADGDAQRGGVGRWAAVWNGNHLEITHPAILEEDYAIAQDFFKSTTELRRAVVSPQSTTSCHVYFYDQTNTLVAAPDAYMDFYLDRGAFILDASYSGHISLSGCPVRLDPARFLNVIANIWVWGRFFK